MMEPITPFDPADHLDTPDDVVVFLNDALADGDLAYFTHALGVVARSRGMAEIARKAGINRATMYSALSAGGNPTMATVLAVLRQLGLSLGVREIERDAA